MDVWRITVAALRRWYVLLPLLALSGLAAYVAGNGVNPEYDATASAIVVPGQSAQTSPNPYGNVEDANAVLGIVLNSPETHSQIAAMGLSPSFEIVSVTRSTITNISVRADSPEVATATGDAILQIAAAELENRQTKAGVAPNEQYGLDVLQTPALSAMVTEGKIRNMAIVGVLGAGASLTIAVLFDDIVGLIRRRRGRKARKLADDSSDHPDEESQDDPNDPNDPNDLETPESSLPSPKPIRDQKPESRRADSDFASQDRGGDGRSALPTDQEEPVTVDVHGTHESLPDPALAAHDPR